MTQHSQNEPNEKQDGHPLCRFGPGGDFTADWPTTPRFAGDTELERCWNKAKAANERLLQKSQQLPTPGSTPAPKGKALRSLGEEGDHCPTGAVAGFVVIGFFAFLMGAALATIALTI